MPFWRFAYIYYGHHEMRIFHALLWEILDHNKCGSKIKVEKGKTFKMICISPYRLFLRNKCWSWAIRTAVYSSFAVCFPISICVAFNIIWSHSPYVMRMSVSSESPDQSAVRRRVLLFFESRFTREEWSWLQTCTVKKHFQKNIDNSCIVWSLLDALRLLSPHTYSHLTISM